MHEYATRNIQKIEILSDQILSAFWLEASSPIQRRRAQFLKVALMQDYTTYNIQDSP